MSAGTLDLNFNPESIAVQVGKRFSTEAERELMTKEERKREDKEISNLVKRFTGECSGSGILNFISRNGITKL